jgi:hypothetical protein
MRLTLLLLLLATLLFAAPAPAQTLAPDAALIAYSPDGTLLDAASWELAAPGYLEGRRVWADVFGLARLGDLEDVGIGASIDVRPQEPLCFGGGYKQGWLGYVGWHQSF